MPVQDRRAFLGLSLLCALVYVPPFFATIEGRLPFASDVLAAFGPWHEFSRQALARGTLPLWNPHVFCGMPFMANGQSAVLYPPNLIYALLPLRFALLGDAWGHNVLLALGTYILARNLGQSRRAALLAAGLLALSGAVSARLFAGHMTWHAARAWTPWLLWALLCFLRHGQPRFILLWALFAALQLSAGHPPVALLGLCLCCGLITAIFVSRRVRKMPILPPKGTLWLFTGALLMFVLCAATWLPLLESTRLSTHGGFSFEFATRGSGNLKSLVRLLLPNFFGGNQAPQWSLRNYGHEEAASLGLLGGILALFAPILARDSKNHLPRAVFWLWLLLPVAFILAMGRHTPVYRFVFEHLPGLSSLRVPVRWFELWILPGALLAGFSCDGLFADQRKRLASLFFGSVQAAVAVFFALSALILSLSGAASWFHTIQLRNAAIESVALGFAVAALSAIFVFAARRKQGFGHGFIALAILEMVFLFWRSSQIPTQSQSIAWPPQILARFHNGQRWETNLGGAIPQMNGGLTRGIDVFSGYDPATPRRFFQFASALEGSSFYSLSYEVTHRNSLLRVVGVTHELETGFKLRPYSGAWPRIYLTQRVLRLPEARQMAALKSLSKGDFFAQNQPVVAASDAFLGVEGAKPGQIVSWSRDLNRLDIAVKSASPTVLVVGEAYYPGWRAFVLQDGRAKTAKIELANTIFRGVALPSGASRVTMVYEPQTQRLGIFLSLLGLSAFSATTILLRKKAT